MLAIDAHVPSNEPARDTPGDADPWPRCIRCDYVLLGLSGNVCPECGWQIDWTQARLNEEQRRPGTPVFAARGWKRATAALPTVGMMLFHPLRFARALRYDEPLWPAALVAAGASLYAVAWCAAAEGIRHGDLCVIACFGCAILACALSNTLLLGTICRDRRGLLKWPKRLRLFLLLSLYSTVFVAAWPLVGPPVIEMGGANVCLPCFRLDSDFGPDGVGPLLVRSATYYWWAAVLFAFVCARTNRIWARVLCLPVIWLSGMAAFFAGFLAYDWFGPGFLFIPLP